MRALRPAAIGASLIASAIAMPAHAQAGLPPGSEVGRGDTVTVGAGIAVTTSYDGARDYRIIPGGALLGTVKGHDFRLNGLQLFVDAVPNDPGRRIEIEFGPVVGLNFNRTGNVADARVEALGELKTAVELGARGAIGIRGVLGNRDTLAVAVTGQWDVAGAHRSHMISPAVEYATVLGRGTFMRLALTSEFVGDGYADYNFGIDTAGSVASGLPEARPDGGLYSLGANVLAVHSLGGKRRGWALFGIASYKRLQGDVADSPIVRLTGSPDQFFASVGLGYTF